MCIAIIEWILFVIFSPALAAFMCYAFLPIWYYKKNYGSGWSASRKGLVLFLVVICGFAIGIVLMFPVLIATIIYTIWWICTSDYKAAKSGTQGSNKWTPRIVSDIMGMTLF